MAAGTTQMLKNCVNATAARERERSTPTPVSIAVAKAQFSARLVMEQARSPKTTARLVAERKK